VIAAVAAKQEMDVDYDEAQDEEDERRGDFIQGND
jgi:hypothetical protein